MFSYASIAFRNSSNQTAGEASLGIRQSPRGDRATEPTLGPSGMPLTRGAPCPDIGRIRQALVAAGVRTAWLVPFFTVAGAHACIDLAGEGDGSWRGQLAQAGIACRPVLTGLIEDPACQAVWRDHLARAESEEMKRPPAAGGIIPPDPLAEGF